jgi:hypothetical protein
MSVAHMQVLKLDLLGSELELGVVQQRVGYDVHWVVYLYRITAEVEFEAGVIFNLVKPNQR